MEDFYPMPSFIRLHVGDVFNSAQWYADALGFRSVFALPRPGGQAMNHLRLERYQDLLLIGASEPGQQPPRRDFDINFTYAGDLQLLADQARKLGGKVRGPVPTQWNTLGVTAEDPDGFVIVFSTVLDANRKFEDVMMVELV